MSTLIIPNAFIQQSALPQITSCYIYETENLNVTNQIKLTKNVISIILEGKKKLIKDQSVEEVEVGKGVCIQAGHCLMQEKSANSNKYRSLLLFFDDAVLQSLANDYKLGFMHDPTSEPTRQVIFRRNSVINNVVDNALKNNLPKDEEEVKHIVKEILISLYNENKELMTPFFATVLRKNRELRFKQFVEKHAYSNLNLDEMAFLCGMSLSTFKRRFKLKYGTTPGKWFQLKRLERAKELIETHGMKASDIFAEFGYENLSNFSAALKNTLGIGPRQLKASRKKIFA